MTDKTDGASAGPPRTDDDRVLARRAESIARIKSDADTVGDEAAVVIFKLADETFGIELSHVREIYPVKELTFIPGAPGFIAGIVNVRGEIFSVVDLKHFFELSGDKETPNRHILLLQSERMAFGILADAVLGVNRISPSMLQYNVSTLTGIRRRYLKGIAEGRIVVLDAKRLLEDPDMYVYQEPG